MAGGAAAGAATGAAGAAAYTSGTAGAGLLTGGLALGPAGWLALGASPMDDQSTRTREDVSGRFAFLVCFVESNDILDAKYCKDCLSNVSELYSFDE